MPEIDIAPLASGPLTPVEAAEVEALYAAAFPNEDLFPLIRRLHEEVSDLVSLKAMAEGTLAGHVIFTPSTIEARPAGPRSGPVPETETAGRATPAALLGPLCVAPEHQRQGIGAALIRAGHDKLNSLEVAHVFVLGDPAYYGRHGFVPGSNVEPPCPLPEHWREAWQWFTLDPKLPAPHGILTVPEPWRDPALWTE
ncbi:GNAT family N-acetyltransferase [Hoeflea sp.]|uniref:GNAT family N-acetyltransferase n=1 Tax=Hoeflea sp. TaxID=1940281 RepID=UPI003B523990